MEQSIDRFRAARAATRFDPRRVVLVHANDGSDVRVGKVCRTLARAGFDVHFLGWDRRPGEAKVVDLGGAVSHVMQRQTAFGKYTVTGTARFHAHVIAWISRLRPTTVCAVNEDNAVAVAPLRGLSYRRLVCDIFDALPDRLSHASRTVRAAAGMTARLARAVSDRLIATDEARREQLGPHRAKTVVIENFPEDPGVVHGIPPATAPPRVYVAGSLFEMRGLRQILAVAERVPELQIVAAGWLQDAFATDVFARHPQVSWHGIVSARRSLDLAASCDAIFAFYAPVNVCNVFASPNKVYDALAVGRPVLINEEVRIAGWVVDEAGGLASPYGDVDALERLVRSLPARRADLTSYAACARALFTARYSWASVAPRLERLYREMAS